MTAPSDKALESQLRLAAASRPGSLEARHVYGCTCTPTQDRERGWDPHTAFSWSDIINLECPAHGRLLEQWQHQIERQALDDAMGRLLKDAPFFTGHITLPPERKPRTRLERIRDAAWSAYYGFLEGWRGPW